MKRKIIQLLSLLLFLNSYAQYDHTRVYSTFDNIPLSKSDTFNNGADLIGGFAHFGRNWTNSYMPDWGSWSGWALSNMTDTSTPGYQNQYSAIPGHGVSHTNNYMVSYGNTFIKLDSSTDISGAYFTNSTYVYLDLMNGGDFSKKFGGENGDDPDYFSVKYYSYLMGELVDSTTLYLADFRFSDNSEDYILNDWTYVDFNNDVDVDIRIDSIAIKYESSDTGSFGINTPTYLCMDDFNAISTAEVMPKMIRFDEDTFYNGSDGAGGFNVSHLFFPNNYNNTWGSWSGWSVSSMYDDVTPGYTNQYSSVRRIMSTIPESEWYFESVHFVNNGQKNSVRSPYFNDADEGIFGLVRLPVPVQFHITNATYAALDMRDGSAFSKKFGGDSGDEPDFFRLLVKSVSASNDILNIDTIYLADFRFEDNTQDYILDEWEMAEIVPCDRVDFELQSSDVGQYGMNTPAYFCLSLAQSLTNSVTNKTLPQINVYPNPTQNILNISTDKSIQRIELISADGRIVVNTKDKIVSNKYSFDVSSLVTGVYFAKIYTSNGTSISKFIKQ
ncbi:MAG: Uncharacterised protein [Bacteroidia bacterium]|nr:MAG: Uncharacterised protein [Bacteroidia bacterium]